jgi:type I restriction enzyme S subunit
VKKDWAQHTLGETCEMYQPKTISAKEMKSDGKYPVFGANGIIGRYDQFNHEEPQLLITCRGATCGTVNISLPKSWITGNAMVVRPRSDKLSLEFLAYFFRGAIDFSTVITGSAQPQITRQSLAPVRISIPPPAKQQRIVAVLDEIFLNLETVIANAEKNLKNACELFDSYLNTVFQTGDDWEETTLGEIAEFKNGLNFTRSSRGERVRIVGVRDFQNSFWVPIENLESAQIDGGVSDTYLLRKHDILTVRSNGNRQLIGRCILTPDVLEKTSHSGFTIRIRVSRSDVNPEYLVRYLKSGNARKALIESGDGAQISNLNQQALTALPVKLLDPIKQRDLVNRLREIEAETDRVAVWYQRRIGDLAKLKQSILHKAFSGELTSSPSRATQEAAE